MKMTVIGSGYVGTVTGTCMAELGHEVICADIQKQRMEKLQQGIVPFYEAGLEPLLRTNLEEGRLHFTSDIREGVRHSEIIFLCMGTQQQAGGKPDMKALSQAVDDITAAMNTDGNGYKLIVEKSTLPIKTGEWLQELLLSKLSPGSSFDIAAVPQFMREGNAIRDFMNPDRVVIGAETERAIDILVNIYRPLNAPLLITDINSAELIKHATNAFLAMKISFINSIAQICEKTGADITNVATGIGMDKRIGPDYLNAGIGYGGVFFPKDIQSLVNIADEYHINLDILKTTEVINRYQRISFVERIEQACPDGKAHGKTIAVWGLAYRPNTDDMRDAPSVHIIRGLQKRGAKIRAYDPLATEATRPLLPDITYCDSPYDAAVGADAIAIMTSWEEFTYLNFQKLKEVTDCRLIIDGRNLFSPQRMRTLGFRYISIGRKSVAFPDPTTEASAAKSKNVRRGGGDKERRLEKAGQPS